MSRSLSLFLISLSLMLVVLGCTASGFHKKGHNGDQHRFDQIEDADPNAITWPDVVRTPVFGE